MYLKLIESQVWVDSLTYNLTLSEGETIGKLAITGETSFIYNGELASPNEVNIVKPNWRKTNNYATFPAADSEPNACVTFKDKIWIFGGWSYNPGTENYGSHSYIWTSTDGNDWTMVNDSLPFTHYSGFIVFKDSIRVYTNYQIYSSVDGINWIGDKPVTYEFFGENVRLTVKGDSLFFIGGQMCGYSVDGLNFVLATHNIPPRRYAALKTIKNHLYYFGGQKAGDSLAYFNDVWKSVDSITCTVKSGIPSDFPLYISSKSTLRFENAPLISNFIPMKGSTIGFINYPQLLLPDKSYSNLEIYSSTLTNLPAIKIENNLKLDKVSLPDYSVPVWIVVGGNLWLNDVNSFKSVIINGSGLGDQVIEVKDGTLLSIDRLILNKAKGEFIFKGNYHIKEALELIRN